MSKNVWLLLLLGAVVGAVGGWLYYTYYGCTSGCAITGSPRNSMAYFALVGALTFSSFSNRKKQKAQDGNNLPGNDQ